MANEQDERSPTQIPDSVSGEIHLTDAAFRQYGHQSGPPQVRTGDSVPKQWQPPKNESTPSNRATKA